MKRERPKSFPAEVADLNLDLPALIEASAGTGKTYAIEHLVLRLVAEKPDWKFESLLLLSFTEKTAGDLRKRIRERLKLESDNVFWTAEERNRFFEAHLHCDEASIYTLHGFCHAVLRAHALDNGTLFDSEVAEERVLLESALDGMLRGPWAHDEMRLRELLKAFAAGGSDWRRYLISIALAYQPGRRDVLEPNPSPDELACVENEFRKELDKLATFFRELENGSFPFDQHLRSFGTSKTGKEKFRKDIFVRISQAFHSFSGLESAEKTQAFLRFFLSLKGNLRAVQKGFPACIPAKAAQDAAWAALANTCQNLRNLAGQWEAAKQRRSLGLVAEAVRELRERLVWEKKRHGVLSYDDMVLLLVEALRRRADLVGQLRSRYHACIVDEFQDTDPLQWELLRRLCFAKTEEGSGSQEKPIPLFLVGDPKQAIYGFRGGDLLTYLGARALFHDEAVKGLAQGKGLKENHRSAPELVNALNSVFAQPVWFGLSSAAENSRSWQLPEPSDHIPFTPALLPAEKKDLPFKKARVTLKDFSACETKPEAQKSVQAWVAAEIQNLVARQSFGFGDIAVLTRTNPEAAMAERALRRLGIPCRVRRRGGLFEGVQADQIRLLLALLESAENPKSQAQILLLPFLREEWPRGMPEECPTTIREWAALSEGGEWSRFFHAVLFKSGHIYRLAAETRGGSEVQSLLGLTRALTEEGVRQGHSLRGLLQRFDALRNGEGEDFGVIQDDAPDDRVTFMTLHLSKGLEFPVVFLASLSDGRKPAFYTLRGETGFRHVLDKKDDAALGEYQQQSLEEDKRLFYVGLTRAKDLLYAPLLPERFSRTGSGPLGGFAAEALRAANGKHPELFHMEGSELPSLPSQKPSSIPSLNPAVATSLQNTTPVFPDRDPWEVAGAFFQDRRRRLSSYSQLLKREIATVLEEDGRRLDREEGETESAPPNIADTADIAETLPAIDLPGGKNTGNALHEMLETLDFAAVEQASDAETWLQDSRLLETTKRILRGHNLSEDHAPAALQMVWNTLRMPLPDAAGGDAFRLSSVADRRHEMEFLFPFTGLSTSKLPEDIHSRNGFLWGFMDLIFRHQGRYYLLDWKSNRLDSYSLRDVEIHMRTSHYDLQYQLYAVALDKWLSARLPAYDPQKDFGGVFYLYLRGASPQTFSGFTYRPGEQELRKDYPARLRTVLGLEIKPKTESQTKSEKVQT